MTSTSQSRDLQQLQKPVFAEVSLLQNPLQQRRLNVCSVMNRNSHSQLGSRWMEEPGVTASLMMNVETRALERLEQFLRLDWYQFSYPWFATAPEAFHH